jgi:hypothetical protein
MASHRHRVTTVTDGDSSVEDAEDSTSLRAFTAELDEIAKALEDDARQFRERVARVAVAAPPPPEREGRVSSAARNSSYKTPPPSSVNRYSEEGRSRLTATSVSPHRSYDKDSATATPTPTPTFLSQRAGGETAGRRPTEGRPVLHDDDGVPTPMQTPAPLMFSPLMDSESKTSLPEYMYARAQQRHSRGVGSESKVSWEDALLNAISSSKKPLSVARGEENRAAATGTTPLASTYSKSKSIDATHSYAVDDMRNTIERQEDRIHVLERENDRLKARVRELEAEVGYLDLQRRQRSPLAPPAQFNTPWSDRATYPDVPPPPQPVPFYRHYATPPRESSGRGLPRPAASGSPGSRFVQDLARHIDVDPIYHAALSDIMDEHFARAAQLRREREWDDYY